MSWEPQLGLAVVQQAEGRDLKPFTGAQCAFAVRTSQRVVGRGTS